MADDELLDEIFDDLLDSEPIINNNSSNRFEDDPTNQRLHPISCSFCRKNHRKCDRKIPSCTNCGRKGIVCNYSDPLKKGRRKKSEYPSQGKEVSTIIGGGSSTNHNNIVIEENNQHSIEQPQPLEEKKKKTSHNHSTISQSAPYVTIDKHFTTGDDILLKRSTLDLFTLLESPIQKVDFENYFNLAQSGELKDDVIMALLFASQALIDQRLGDKQSSKLSFNKARKLIQPYFDDLENIHVGCVFYLFCSFETANANYKKVTLYHNILKAFVEDINRMENANNMTLTHTMKKLKILSRFIEMTKTSADIDCNNPLVIAKMFPKLVYAATGVESFMKLYEQLGNLHKDRMEEYLLVIDSVCSFMNNHMKEMDETGDRKNVIDLMSMLVSNGMKLASYLTVDNENWEQIMTHSTNITAITENPLFVFLPSAAVSHVAMAAKQHLRLYSLISLGIVKDFFPSASSSNNTLQQLIYQNYRALSILSKRYDRVQKFYSDLLQELENFIKECFTHQEQHSAESSSLDNQGTTQPFQAHDDSYATLSTTESSLLDDYSFFDNISHYENDSDFQMSPSGLGNEQQI